MMMMIIIIIIMMIIIEVSHFFEQGFHIGLRVHVSRNVPRSLGDFGGSRGESALDCVVRYSGLLLSAAFLRCGSRFSGSLSGIEP